MSESLVHVTQSIFFNGTLDSTRETSSINPIYPDTDADGNFYIGRNSLTGDYFQGKLLFVRIYNRALSESEILTAYSSSIRKWQTELLAV